MAMPPAELKEWISLCKDFLLGLAALVTTGVAIYSAWVWKRELVGKEVYAAAKVLVKESHLLSKEVYKARSPIFDYERKVFSEFEVKHLTVGERWRVSEAAAYKKRIRNLSIAIDRYQSALLDVRVLVGSKAYLGFLPFSRVVTDSVSVINDYVSLMQDYSRTICSESPEVKKLQGELYPSENIDDELSQKIANAREEGEKSLLAFLHRASISG